MIKIVLNNQPPLYPGTMLQGNVHCSFDSSTSVRSIKIRCYGKEYTEWTTGGKNKHTYRGTHYLFQMETKLFEPPSDTMSAGSYVYPFSFLLPANLPSTFEFPYGYIRYSLKGIVDIPLAIDPRERVDLAVISVLDISTLSPDLRLPFQAVQQATFGCCWFYNTEPVRIEAQLNKLVFLPGETIRISMDVINTSPSDQVEGITVKLVRCFVAHSETPRHDTRFIDEDLLQQKLDGVRAASQRNFDVDFQIPTDLGVPNMTGCKLLEGIYRIQVTCSTSGFNRSLEITLAEVKVGHVDGNWNPTETKVISNSSYGDPPYPTNGYPHPTAPVDSKI